MESTVTEGKVPQISPAADLSSRKGEPAREDRTLWLSGRKGGGRVERGALAPPQHRAPVSAGGGGTEGTGPGGEAGGYLRRRR